MSDKSINELISATCFDADIKYDKDGHKIKGVSAPTASYYNYVLGRCKIHCSTEVGTMGVCFDKTGHVNLLYNPDFLKKLTDPEAIAVLKHEALHIFYAHFDRFKDKNHERANIAEDMEINQYLDGLPEGGVYPSTYGMQPGLTAEAYYMQLKDNNMFNQQQMTLSQQGQSDQNQGSGQGQGQQNQDQSEQGSQGQGQGQNQQGQSGKQPGTIDNHDIHNKVCDENGKIVGDLEGSGVDIKPELDSIKKGMMSEIRKLGRGSAPGFAKSELDLEKKQSRTDWKKKLRLIIGNALSPDKEKSQKKVHKRLACVDHEHIFPGYKSGRMPKVMIVRDTSGSMCCAEIQQEVFSEILKITKSTEALVMDCDTKVEAIYKCKKPSDMKTIQTSFQGGGGTSFKEPFFRTLKEFPSVNVIIYITDLYGDFPDKNEVGRFCYRTIWVSSKKMDGDKNPPPFGKVVWIDPEIPDEHE